jgi:sugar/nucleoside kinase (ribokinase family)
MNHFLVLGGASQDTLHLQDRSVTAAGGAGMYTAMAAWRCGARVAMFCPKPSPCPTLLRPVFERLTDCPGPVIAPQENPRFEISYRSGMTEYLSLFFGAEDRLTPDVLPDDLSKYDLAHVIPIGDPRMQLAFVQACRARGVQRISAGTFPIHAEGEPAGVRAVIEASDIFFMNKREATAVFGSLEEARVAPGKLLFVTMGKEGACIIQGAHQTRIPAAAALEIDPTGAGDTFCGATLAFLLQGDHPMMAARRAAALAAEMIGRVGPSALMVEMPPPQITQDGRVRVNELQLRKIAAKVSSLMEEAPFPFTGPEYPPVGHPAVLDYFFAATLQQFSFWSTVDSQYSFPLIAPIGGLKRKGSDYMWTAYTRALQAEPDFCSVERQASLSLEEMRDLFRADDGQDPMPALELHLQQARAYGRDMLALDLTPRLVLEKALASPEPLQTFLGILDHIGGYKEDPLRKKPGLLALILNQRPERFLPLRAAEQVPPVIDYHLMRSALRTGLVDVLEQELEGKLSARQVVTAEEEWAVRYPT